MSQKEVEVLPGIAPWVGGKRYLAARIGAMIDGIHHDCYCEPFVGMGGIFFRRKQRPGVEVINDWSRDVVNLFRVLKHHNDALREELSCQLYSRWEFERQLRTNPDDLTDIQRAARFYFLQRSRFGGMPDSGSFPATAKKSKAIRPDIMRRFFTKLHDRLALVTIEHLQYQDFIARYDRPTTLFYLDPPYYGCENLYGKGLFDRSDFQRLAGQLKGIKGRFLMSLNDHPEIRETFSEFKIDEITTSYSLSARKKVTELLIMTP
ncbi:MAG: DNA adenine methylase [Nitrospirae bacterium]|nr:DNA adenine methylase [Magnetococcales bacterium]HAT51489.1 DNA methyltransferase [Alphaproteobacteria bacterium]